MFCFFDSFEILIAAHSFTTNVSHYRDLFADTFIVHLHCVFYTLRFLCSQSSLFRLPMCRIFTVLIWRYEYAESKAFGPLMRQCATLLNDYDHRANANGNSRYRALRQFKYGGNVLPRCARKLPADSAISWILLRCSEKPSQQKMIQREEESAVPGANTTNLGFATPEKQQARAFLRERFLRIVTGVVGKKFYSIIARTRSVIFIKRRKFEPFPASLVDTPMRQTSICHMYTPYTHMLESSARHVNLVNRASNLNCSVKTLRRLPNVIYTSKFETSVHFLENRSSRIKYGANRGSPSTSQRPNNPNIQVLQANKRNFIYTRIHAWRVNSGAAMWTFPRFS